MLISHLLGLPAAVDADPSAIIIAADLGGRISTPLPWNRHASMATVFPKWILLGFCFFILPMSELKSHVVESEWQNLGHIPVPWVQIEVEKVAFWLLLALEVCRMHETGIFLKQNNWKSAILQETSHISATSPGLSTLTPSHLLALYVLVIIVLFLYLAKRIF